MDYQEWAHDDFTVKSATAAQKRLTKLQADLRVACGASTDPKVAGLFAACQEAEIAYRVLAGKKPE